MGENWISALFAGENSPGLCLERAASQRPSQGCFWTRGFRPISQVSKHRLASLLECLSLG